jgi:uncharacterized protein (DUF2384 family)
MAEMTSKAVFPLEVRLAKLHDQGTGRIDAERIASYLRIPLTSVASAIGAKYQSVHKTPDAENIQKALAPIKRSLELVSRVTRDEKEARVWLNNPHPDLDNQTPLQVILEGNADAVITLLENAISGIPS